MCKYKGFHEGHHFILMAMEVHGISRYDMDHFVRECAHFFHDRWSKGHLSLSFYIQFFRQCVNIAFQHALTSTIERKIVLVSDVCSKPPITIRSHHLHASVNIVFQHALTSTIERKRLCWWVMFVLNLPLLLDLTICMQVTLERPWVR
jgi:hypothetical protein